MAYQPDWKTNTATEELVRIYRTAKNKIISDLTAVDVSDYKETEAMKAMSKIQGALAELNGKARRWAAIQIPKSYEYGKGRTRIQLEILGARPSKRFDRQTHDRSKGEYFELVMKDLNRANATIKRTADTIIHLARTASATIDILPETAPMQAYDDEAYLQDVFKNWATKGVQEGYTRKWLSKLVKGRLLENMEGGQFIVVNGRHFTLDYYAEMVGRTRMRESQSEAAKNMSQEYDNDLMIISHHANPCAEICKPLEDQIYSISGMDLEYPALTEETTPPFHPNCEHSISPTSRTAMRISEKYA
jgi:hypothetical protein